jgi:hypothetical protein
MAEAIVGGKKIQFVLPDGLRSKQIVVKFDAAPRTHTGPTPEATPDEHTGPSGGEPTTDAQPEEPQSS